MKTNIIHLVRYLRITDNQIEIESSLTLTPTLDTIVLTFFWASTNPDLKFAYASLCA